jgi:hypothetical protein
MVGGQEMSGNLCFAKIPADLLLRCPGICRASRRLCLRAKSNRAPGTKIPEHRLWLGQSFGDGRNRSA